MNRPILFDRDRLHEARRRLTRRTLQSLLRKSEAQLRSGQSFSPGSIRRVLICRPNHRLGNLVLLTPLLAELQQLFPNAVVDVVLAGGQGAELFRTFPNVGYVHVLHRRMIRHPLAVARVAMQIRRARYDVAIDPCTSSQSSRLLVAIAKAKYAIGVPRGEMQETVVQQLPKHMAKWPVALLRRTLSPPPTEATDCSYPRLGILLSPAERDAAALALRTLLPNDRAAQARPVVGVFADATGAKRYPESWWAGFLTELRKRLGDCAVVEIAPPDGRSRLPPLAPAFSSPSVREVAAVISHMTCFISADCGVMHLACASGTPTIGLFSATDPAKYEPYGNGSQAIRTNGMSPGEVARVAGTLIEQIRMRDLAGPVEMEHVRQAGPGSPS